MRYISNFEATVTILNTMKFEAFCGISFYPYTPMPRGIGKEAMVLLCGYSILIYEHMYIDIRAIRTGGSRDR